MAEFIKADNTVIEVQPKSKSGKYTLKELQEYVGGYIELVTLVRHGQYMVVNEEGKIYDLPVNGFATEIALKERAIMPHDTINGNVIIIKQNEID